MEPLCSLHAAPDSDNEAVDVLVPAGVHLRSSKDRHDVSLQSQLRAVEGLAAREGFRIAKIYEDAVECGSSEDRPAWQKLILDVRNPNRGWQTLLAYDTSRLARGRYIAQVFKHECKRHKVAIRYSVVPKDIDPVSEIMIEAMFEAMDEIHSIVSRLRAWTV